ncbi:hypothetical protein V2J09_008594 [Rumex salicifolius]
MGEMKSFELESLLCTKKRDFLIRNNGDHVRGRSPGGLVNAVRHHVKKKDSQVNVKELRGKTVGLYFSASWCGGCRAFTPVLAQSTNSSSPISRLYKWLAMPFSDRTKRRLNGTFKVSGIPLLIFIDAVGNVVSSQGVRLVRVVAFKLILLHPKGCSN